MTLVHVVIGLRGYLLLEGFNPNPLCTDTERNTTHKERQNVHIFVLSLTQSDIVHVMFTNLNCPSTYKHIAACAVSVKRRGYKTRKIQNLDRTHFTREPYDWGSQQQESRYL